MLITTATTAKQITAMLLFLYLFLPVRIDATRYIEPNTNPSSPKNNPNTDNIYKIPP